jgi:hypothetical protein
VPGIPVAHPHLARESPSNPAVGAACLHGVDNSLNICLNILVCYVA